MKFDLAIIGGGPGGYVAAERAGAKGLNVVLFEKKALGGVCLNEGCIPTKTLLYSAKVYDTAKNAAKYGISSNDLVFDYAKIAKRKDKVVRKLVGGVRLKMKQHNVTVVNENATILERKEDGICIAAGEESYFADKLIIATGSEAFVPPIPGLNMDDNHIMTNREILQSTTIPKSLAIIGGGVIGMEFASLYNSFGVEVTVIEMMDKILGEMDVEMSQMLQSIYEKRGVKIELAARVTEIKGHDVIYEKNGEQLSTSAENILVSVGRRPVTNGFGLENIGVELLKSGIKVNEKMETTVPNVYAIGDVTGFSLLAHTASREGEVVVNNITGENDTMSYNAIPGVVYTNPEFSGVGHTEKTAQAQGLDYSITSLPMAYAGRFVAENEGGNGLCKVLVDNNDKKVLGVHMLGNPSSEMIHGACMTVQSGMTLDELKKVVFPHPTVSEIFKEAIFDFK